MLQGHNDDFQSMINFVSSRNGKRIRPLILLLSAKLCGETNQKTIDYAIILELLHTATLIHDDVVDNTMERRSQPSANAKYDNRLAVLLGDYILSLAITQAVLAQNFAILNIISRLAQNLAEGELTQLISSKELLFDEKRYFEVIWKKTAVLLSSCSEMGALSVDASPENREKLRLIGENLGICFQIKDDIFDYFEQGEIGKPTGNDIREGKITLPLIHALKTAPKEISDAMFAIIQKKNYSPENIKQLTDFAKAYHGIEYAQSKMLEIKEKTITLLNDFPDSETKTALIHLIDYIIEREK
ncbi:octaprenyl-diphosphate synthase [Bacteroidia bacterium]|nr:octaprenyl-diphosphate synthase [Bacteroidia bacterium]